MSNNNFDKDKFVEEIDEAVPKYEKTLKHLNNVLLHYEKARGKKEKLEIQKKLEEEKTKIVKAIENLKITRQLYSPTKRELGFVPEDYNEKELKTEAKEAVKSSDNLGERINRIQDGLTGTKKTLSRNQAFAAGALILTAGLAIGITLLTQGTSTHTQLDIFLLSNNVTEFYQNKYQNYENLRISASFKQIVGAAVLIGGYLLGVAIMLEKKFDIKKIIKKI